ncbi:unnamed protein product [Vicia faba]|uniref:Uncharacterized protein n=1 Tax=Vicia faba TaxID=3906 RepID=A0AAV0ZD39_VICFA|nr:unnamed protein product [Vicia faba]
MIQRLHLIYGVLPNTLVLFIIFLCLSSLHELGFISLVVWYSRGVLCAFLSLLVDTITQRVPSVLEIYRRGYGSFKLQFEKSTWYAMISIDAKSNRKNMEFTGVAWGHLRKVLEPIVKEFQIKIIHKVKYIQNRYNYSSTFTSKKPNPKPKLHPPSSCPLSPYARLNSNDAPRQDSFFNNNDQIEAVIHHFMIQQYHTTGSDVASLMEIRWPSNVRHIAHVTDRAQASSRNQNQALHKKIRNQIQETTKT